MEQEEHTTKSIVNLAPIWSDAELRRVSHVFDLLIRIDKRIKKGKSYEGTEDIHPKKSDQDNTD